MSRKTYIRGRGTRRAAAFGRSTSPDAPTTARKPRANTAKGYTHAVEANPDGPSDIERGNIATMGERQAVALRAALDDAMHSIARRFNLAYAVERGIADGAGCDYRIRLLTKAVAKAPRRAMIAAR
jgi:hypothetical protein